VSLADDLDRVAQAAEAFADDGEEIVGILPTEPSRGERIYLCAFARANDRSWLALDEDGAPVESRARVREAVSIAALCEVADETAGGGDLSELRSQLVTLRITESPPGIEEAEEAALALEGAVAAPPRLASPQYLDALGEATRRLEQALGDSASSPFAEALRRAIPLVEELTREVEGTHKRPLG
jgi:hypothetical protein